MLLAALLSASAVGARGLPRVRWRGETVPDAVPQSPTDEAQGTTSVEGLRRGGRQFPDRVDQVWLSVPGHQQKIALRALLGNDRVQQGQGEGR